MQVKQAKIDAEFKEKTQGAIDAAVGKAVQAFANMLTMCTIAEENADAVPENLRGNVAHYNKALKAVLNTANPHADYNWKASRDQFTKSWTKLVNDADVVSGLNAAFADDSSLDKVIVCTHKVEAAPVEEPEPVAEEPAAATQEQAEPEETAPAAEQPAEDAAAEGEENKGAEGGETDRRRGGRGGRGGRGRPRTGQQRNGEDEDGFKVAGDGE